MDSLRDNHRVARLILVDDHAFVRAGIKAVIGSDGSLEVVGEAGDGGEALKLCRALDPDLVLMDVSMPGMDGIEAARRIKAQAPMTSVLILTAHDDGDLLMDAGEAGVVGHGLEQIVAQVPAQGQAVGDYLHELTLRAEVLEEHHQLQLEEDHRVHRRSAAPA